MKNKGFFLLVLSLFAFGVFGPSIAQARCLSLMSQAKSGCCCTANDQKSHCPKPAKKTDCPMFTQTQPAFAMPSIKFFDNVTLVYVRSVTAETVKPSAIFSHVDDRQTAYIFKSIEKTAPPFRAPPVSPTAA